MKQARPEQIPANAPAGRPVDVAQIPKEHGQRPGTVGSQAQPALAAPLAPGSARPKRRHRWLAFSFFLLVVIPVALAGAYLYQIAADQYASRTGFLVRQEERASSAVEMLGGMADMYRSASSTLDTDVLNEYIRSEEMVTEVNERLDLIGIFSKPEWDPVFSFDTSGTIEDLVEFWRRMITIDYDRSTSLIELRVNAFDPNDAQAIAQVVFDESSRMINELSAIAREDATRYAREELEAALDRLKDAREALTRFRVRTQTVDPSAELQGRIEVLNNLQGQLADAFLELELVRSENRGTDPNQGIRQDLKIADIERRIAVIRQRIEQERQKFGVNDDGLAGESYATLISEFDRLTLDQEFAQQAYLAAFAAYNSKISEAQRQSKYLAAYIKPTLAQRPEYPRRGMLLGMTALFLFLAWTTATLVYYALRERR